jgi:hypothetical protein
VGTTTFDTHKGFVAICSSVAVLLASCVLWDVSLVYPGRFYLDNLVWKAIMLYVSLLFAAGSRSTKNEMGGSFVIL